MLQCNQKFIDWYLKQKRIVETGSDFTAEWIAVDRIIELRTALPYLGVYDNAKSFMLGDSKAPIPNTSLSKEHNILAYFCVCEIIAAKNLLCYWIDEKQNPADIVRKHWRYPQVWHIL
jgi:hypothetical protein